MAPGMFSLQMALDAAASTTEMTLAAELAWAPGVAGAAAATGLSLLPRPRIRSKLSLLCIDTHPHTHPHPSVRCRQRWDAPTVSDM